MILCVGTTPAVQRVLFLNEFKLNQDNKAVDVRQCAAGKAVNAARVLRTLGESPLAMGFVGGATGAFIENDLDAIGVSHSFVDVPEPTRICFTLLDRGAVTATELVESPTRVGESQWNELRARIAKALPHARMMILSGSLPPDAPLDFYAECVRAAAETSVPVIVDASGEPLQRALAAAPLVIKPNRSELAQTTGLAVDSAAALRRAMLHLLSLGPRWVITTMGADGAALTGPNGTWRIHVPRIQPVSAIGSGDSFTAGLAVAILRGREMAEAVQFAAACGISNALDPLPGRVRPDEVDRFCREVRIEPLR